MENDVLDALADIGYNGPLLKPDGFSQGLEQGLESPDFRWLIHSLAQELKELCSLEEVVSADHHAEDMDSFLMELASFLKELGCPYVMLFTGNLGSRLQKKSDKLLLLDFLLSELMAARMLAVNKPGESKAATMEVLINESQTARDLQVILRALKMSQPPANISTALLFQKLVEKLNIAIKNSGPTYVGRPLYNKSLTEKQWKEVEMQHKTLAQDFQTRREMLVTRLDCTIQSFEWSGKGTQKRDQIESVYRPLRSVMKTNSQIRLSDFLAARSDLLALKKTSDSAVRVKTKSDVNKVIIGKVPDRGGRPSEQQAPPPEMPSWQQQRPQMGGVRGGGGGRGGGGRGGGGTGGGSRVQGGWSQQGGDSRGGGNRGNYQDNRGNAYQDNRNQDFQDGRRNSQGYQDNRGNNESNNRRQFDNQQNNRRGYQGQTQGYQGQNQTYQPQNQAYQGQNQGYQGQNQGYQGQNQGYQGQNQVYQGQNQGYQSQSQGYHTQNQGYQGQDSQNKKGRYQNEHDNRANRDGRGGSGRGRSNYNRGGMH